MADGDADQTETGDGADAGQTTGDTQGDAGQAGDGQTGGTGDSELDPQAIYNRGAKEAREAMEGKLESQQETIQSLRSELEQLRESEDKRKSPEDRSDVYTEEQVEELKESYQSKIEQREEAVQSANRAHARNVLIEALREHNVVKPEMFADLLVDKGRVQADVTEGFDAIEVRTPEGNKMLTESGDEASVQDLAARWAEQNPEFVRDGQQAGSGFDQGGEPTPTTLEDVQRKAERNGEMNTATRAKARQIMGNGNG